MKIDILSPRLSEPDEAARKFCAKSLKTPFSIEMVFLPFVLFTYRICLTRLLGKEKTERGLFLVDLMQGIPINIRKKTIIEVDQELQKKFDFILSFSVPNNDKKRNKVHVERRDVEEKHVMPILLKMDEAIDKGKTLLRYDIMRLVGHLSYRKMSIFPEPKRKVLYYPYWLIYYRNKRGEMRYDVLDALSGQKEDGQIGNSIKMGLLKSAKKLTDSSTKGAIQD